MHETVARKETEQNLVFLDLNSGKCAEIWHLKIFLYNVVILL